MKEEKENLIASKLKDEEEEQQVKKLLQKIK
jgi:hypothetical protein